GFGGEAGVKQGEVGGDRGVEGGGVVFGVGVEDVAVGGDGGVGGGGGVADGDGDRAPLLAGGEGGDGVGRLELADFHVDREAMVEVGDGALEGVLFFGRDGRGELG